MDNYTNITNSDAILGIAKFVNASTGGALGILILLSSIVVITSVLSMTYEFRKVIAPSLFVNTILAIMLAWMDLLPDFAIYVMIILTIGATIWIIVQRDK